MVVVTSKTRLLVGVLALGFLGGGVALYQRQISSPKPLPPLKKIFVVGVLSGVHAIDVKTGKMGPGIDTGILPHNLALSPDGKRLFVSNVGSQSVSVIDVDTEKKVGDILVGQIPDNPAHQKLGPARMNQARSCYECHNRHAVGSLPNALSWDSAGQLLMVNEIRNRSVTFLDPVAKTQVRSVKFTDLPTPAAPAHMVVHPKTGEIWVLHRFEGAEQGMGSAAGEHKPLQAQNKDDFRHDAPLGQRVSWVTVHDAEMKNTLARIKMDMAIPFDGQFSADGRWLYVGYRSADRIAVFDTQAKMLVRQIVTGTSPTGLAMSPDKRKLYVTCLHSKPPVVQVIDAETGEIESSLQVPPSPSLVVTDPATGLIYVTVTGYNAVLEIDPVARKLVRQFPAGHQPLALVLTR
jgi:YVTN family beta-propeller protein